ncbi:hypothetical protein ACJIZ3_009662 [Penstemon smallii]|uniref:Survival Motor Neuron Gemin2-binding domain-containing protein n=1 Tax=Penstemon smallii TaxID=265156 RepID=A0ABD3TE89_9LAMI
MGKEGELWDDSALIKAFDSAISKYKVMHAVSVLTEENIPNSNAQENIPDNGSNEHVPNDNTVDAALDTAEKNGESTHVSQVLENHTTELDFSTKHMPSSSDVKSQNEVTWYSNDPEECNQLWNKYYELEDQRQKILQQLNQYSNWNYQNSVTSAFTPEEPQISITQPYDTVTCYCPYGCQNWVVPCNSLPASCSGGTCTDKCCTVISKGAEEDPDIVKTAMAAAERALSSLTKEASSIDISANGGKDKEVTQSTGSGTDLAMVLNAWYSAGLYTGKYLSEQSFEKRRHG